MGNDKKRMRELEVLKERVAELEREKELQRRFADPCSTVNLDHEQDSPPMDLDLDDLDDFSIEIIDFLIVLYLL